MRLTVYSLEILAMVLVSAQRQQECFLVNAMFRYSMVWKQKTSVDEHTVMSISWDEPDTLSLDNYKDEILQDTKRMYCESVHGTQNFLVIEYDTTGSSYYRCLHLKPINKNVFMLSRTMTEENRKRINCLEAEYTEDSFLWFANINYENNNCPLRGGYQLVISGNNLGVSSECVDSIYTYNPNIQFQCDSQDSGNVMVELGNACVFHELGPNRANVLARNFVTFRCMTYWTSKTYVSLLLEMKENENQVWCIQFNRQDAESGYLTMYLSIIGKCPGDFETINPIHMSLDTFYGALVRYTPAAEEACQNETVICAQPDVCVASNHCPTECNRCIVGPPSPCEFVSDLHKTWSSLKSLSNYKEVVVSEHHISGYFGNFTCATEIRSDLSISGNLEYLISQVYTCDSCIPLFACLFVDTLADGVASFRFMPVLRRQTDGNLYSCGETFRRWVFLEMIDTDRTYTLFNLEKLHKRDCDFQQNSFFSTSLTSCMVLINNCTGTCHTLFLKLDNETCDSNTLQNYPIYRSHTCYGLLGLHERIEARIMLVNQTGAFFCWIFYKSHLYVVSPEHCNNDMLATIMEDEGSFSKYDPLKVLSSRSRMANVASIPINSYFVTIWVSGIGAVVVTNTSL